MLIIASVAAACALGGAAFYFFYNAVYGVLFSVAVALIYATRKREPPASLGLTRPGAKQYAVAAVFVALSVGGQAIPFVIGGAALRWERLLVGFLPLVMTTFFEEFLFRGFLQTRFEQLFGALPAIALSGLCFSLYHLGYPGFRNFADLAVLFAVGAGFGLAYKLSGNSLAAAYLVNLPNALLTYLIKYDQFPAFDIYSVIAAAVSIAAIIAILRAWLRRATSSLARAVR